MQNLEDTFNRSSDEPIGEPGVLLTAWDQLQHVLGVNQAPTDLDSVGIAIRTAIVYITSLALVRIASRRFLSQSTAFDIVVGIMLGSIMSRAINGSALFLPTIVAGLVLVGWRRST